MNANVGCRVLVAEDEPDTLDGLVRILSRRGYQVHGASGGLEAAEKLKGNLFDVVVSDLKMPDMSGMDLLRFVMKRCAETVFVMITAYATTASADEAMKLGAFDYVNKPFDMKNLIDTIERGRKQKRAAAEMSAFDRPVSEIVESPPVDHWLRSVWQETRMLDLDLTLNAVIGLARRAFGVRLSFEKMLPQYESCDVAEKEPVASQNPKSRIPLYGDVYLVLESWGDLDESEQMRLVQFLRRVVFGKLVLLG